MQRVRRRRSEEAPKPEHAETSIGATPVAVGNGAAGGAVQVIWGAMTQQLDLAELSVREAHQLLSAPYHIPGGVQALVNGEAVDPDQALAVGDTLEFARAAGEKGGG